jgi:hypothetical protein
MFSLNQTSNAQSPAWRLGDQEIRFNNTTPNTTIPNAPPFEDKGFNSIVDVNQNILFYVDNGRVYYGNGQIMGDINVPYLYPNPNYPNSSTIPYLTAFQRLSGYPEICIVPKPGSCTNYYVIGGYAYSQVAVSGFTGVDPNLVYAEIDMTASNPKYPIPNQLGSFVGVQSNGNVVATQISPINTGQFANISYHTSDIHIGVTKLTAENDRTLFIARGGILFRSRISNAGIGFPEAFPLYPTGLGSGSNSVKSELEIYESFDPKTTGYRLAIPNGSSSTDVTVLTVSYSGLNHSNAIILGPFPSSNGTSLKGIEFSPNGSYLYATFLNTPYLRCFNTTTGAPVTLPQIVQSDLEPFAYSMIEKNNAGNLILVDMFGISNNTNGNLGILNNPNNPSTCTFNPTYASFLDPLVINPGIGTFELFGFSFPVQIAVLPDQIDGESFNTNFDIRNKSCCNYLTEFDAVNFTVNNTDVWQGSNNPINNGSAVVKINDFLVIRPNVTLEVTDMTFEFGYLGKLIIEPGGKLIANGCTFTGNTFCEMMWFGIIVQGDISNGQKGHLIMRNNQNGNYCKVKNAIKGISFGSEDEGFPFIINNFDGGLMEIKDVSFENNFTSIEYTSHPIGNIHSLVENCNFFADGNLWYPYFQRRANYFIHTINVDAGNITFFGINRFDGATYGYNLQNSIDITLDENRFKNCLVGIWSNNTGTATSHCTITGNKFENTHTCVRIENGRDDNITGNNFNTTNGSQKENFYGVFLDNTSGFSILDNLFNYQRYGVYVINSGKGGGLISRQTFGNYFTGCWRGIHSYRDNSRMEISCNKFINNVPLNWPNNYSAAWYINGDLADQGDANQFGVNNEFLRMGSRKDIASILDNTTNSCDPGFNFCYTYTFGISNLEPTINPTFPYANPQSFPNLRSICTRQLLMDLANNDELVARQIINEETNELQKQIWINELIRWYIVNYANDSLVSFLQSSSDLTAHELLFFHHISQNNYSSANGVLTELSANSEIDAQQFVALNTITLLVAQNNISIKAIDSASIATITSIATTDTRISAQARTMLSQILDSMQNIEIITDTLGTRVGDFELENRVFTLSPNPASNQTKFQLSSNDFSGELFIDILDICGRLQQTVKILNSTEQLIDFVDYQSGVYFVNLRDRNDLIESQKIILTNN